MWLFGAGQSGRPFPTSHGFRLMKSGQIKAVKDTKPLLRSIWSLDATKIQVLPVQVHFQNS